MKPLQQKIKSLSDTLQEHCPFILFAMLSSQEGRENTKCVGRIELSVYIDPTTTSWLALEKILAVFNTFFPLSGFEVTLLNRVDAQTRYRSVHDPSLFIRAGMDQHHHRFVHRALLDYRLSRAHARKNGIIDNE
jgi:hypothetical protein